MVNKVKYELLKLAENLGLFALLILVIKVTTNVAGYESIDFKFIYIALVAALLGPIQCLVSVVLVQTLCFYEVIRAGIDVEYMIYSIDPWIRITIYMIGGLIISYAFMLKKEAILKLQDKYDELQEENDKANSYCVSLLKTKDELQKQILLSKDSFGQIYTLEKEMQTFNPRLIFYRAIDAIEKIMETDSVSIYSIDEQTKYGRLIACSDKLSEDIDASINIEDIKDISKQIKNKGIFVNKSLKEDSPDFAMPIYDGDNIVALVMVNDLSFEKHTLYYQNVFYLVVNIIQNHLVKAIKYNELAKEGHCIEGTNIFTYDKLKEEIKVLKDIQDTIDLKYCVCNVTNESGEKIQSSSSAASDLVNIMRTTDILGVDKKNNLTIVLVQLDKDDIDRVQPRFLKHGYRIQLEEV